MNAWSILAIVLAIGTIALVGFMIPILIQVKDLLKLAETTVLRIEKDVEPVLQNVEGITHNFEGITGAANDFVNRKPKEKVISNEPEMIDSIKETVIEGVKVVKEEYIPEAKFAANKYFKAARVGLNVAINNFKSSRPIPADKQMVVYEKHEVMKVDDTYKPAIVDSIVMK
ncbi:DUF948 domain-containing protein [bacterium]|nr:MAG: DUF948 domain-containing protein [bacterium]